MIKFEVKVIGHPKPQVKWMKAGEEIIPSDEFQIENLEDGTSILIINDVYPDDTGEIRFEAFNSVGVAETITQFVVEGKIKFSRFLNYFNKNKEFFQRILYLFLKKRFAAPNSYICLLPLFIFYRSNHCFHYYLLIYL